MSANTRYRPSQRIAARAVSNTNLSDCRIVLPTAGIPKQVSCVRAHAYFLVRRPLTNAQRADMRNRAHRTCWTCKLTADRCEYGDHRRPAARRSYRSHVQPSRVAVRRLGPQEKSPTHRRFDRMSCHWSCSTRQGAISPEPVTREMKLASTNRSTSRRRNQSLHDARTHANLRRRNGRGLALAPKHARPVSRAPIPPMRRVLLPADPTPPNASSLRVRMEWFLEEDHAPEVLHAQGNRREAAAS
jgi:hypothetical protein